MPELFVKTKTIYVSAETGYCKVAKIGYSLHGYPDLCGSSCTSYGWSHIQELLASLTPAYVCGSSMKMLALLQHTYLFL